MSAGWSNARRCSSSFWERPADWAPGSSVLLVQLPPSFAFDAEVAGDVFPDDAADDRPRHRFRARHASWFTGGADALLRAFRVARVAADPARVAGGDLPAAWPDLAYFRLHGSPRIYFSDYEADALGGIEQRLREFAASSAEVWCIFDNTAASHALGNALAVAGVGDAQITLSSRNARPSAMRS